MFRTGRLAIALGVVVLAAPGPAHAQYGGYGWGGWGGGGGNGGGVGTVQGGTARGLGYLDMGAGVYNLDSAQAGSINTDSAMRWDTFMYQGQQTANRAEAKRMNDRMKRDASAGAAQVKRIHDNPSGDDITSGNALNSALDDVTNPKIHASGLRSATDKIPGSLVREIPFTIASEAVTINLDTLTNESGWPAGLGSKNYADEKKAYSDAVDTALKEDTDGDISPETIQNVRQALDKLRAKFEASPPTDKAEFGAAQIHLKTLYNLTNMLKKPKIDKIIAELETVKETTLGSLLAFMHTYNLRFGAATTTAQQAAYQELYPMIGTFRDKLTKGLEDDKDNSTAKADSKGHPGEFLGGMHLDHLSGKRKPGIETPGNPG